MANERLTPVEVGAVLREFRLDAGVEMRDLEKHLRQNRLSLYRMEQGAVRQSPGKIAAFVRAIQEINAKRQVVVGERAQLFADLLQTEYPDQRAYVERLAQEILASN